jgi:arylsulfatase A-like enzyme
MTDIALITIDSLRYDHLSCYGYERETTPNIDAIAEDAVLFENAFAHAGSTKFSFPSILSSTYSPMYGGASDMEERLLISSVLKSEGYDTAGFHSNPFLNMGYATGFDRFYDPKDNPSEASKLRQFVQRNLSHSGLAYKLIKSVYRYVEQVLGSEIGSAYEDAASMTSLAIDWLRDREEASWFLWIHYMDPHHPYLPPDDYAREFCDAPVSERESIELRKKMLEEPEEMTEREINTIVNLYDSEVRFVDDQIGRLIEYITGMEGNASVIIAADHGEEFGERGQFSHGSYYEECIHVPLIVDEASSDGKLRRDELVGLIDVPPTITELAGCDTPTQYLGKRLLTNDSDRDRIIGGWVDGDQEISFCRDRIHKGVSRNRNDETELYDVSSGTDTPVDGQFPERITEGIGEFQSYIGEKITEGEFDQTAEERLRDLGYLE